MPGTAFWFICVFFGSAIASVTPAESMDMKGLGTDGEKLYYDPVYILRKYRQEPKWVARAYLHSLMHCVFYHSFQYEKLEGQLWDLAADIAVESVILDMRAAAVTLRTDEEAARRLTVLRQRIPGGLTAEKLYRHFRASEPSRRDMEDYQRLFCRDLHESWKAPEELAITESEWKRISERIRTEVRAFTGESGGGDGLEENLKEAVREKYDYGDLLRRFMVSGEEMTVNDNEFDFVYYTYGLQVYGNLPLIEPLEYHEILRVRDFIIAIDTSASCRGATVKAFLRKTYGILKEKTGFFNRMNVHIIQCDSQIQQDVRITCEEELEAFIEKISIRGFGGTDFRPVFRHVEELRAAGEFEKLKGLIYFTDGYGVYPERMPDYEVIFAFLEEDENRLPVPLWSTGIVLDGDELELEVSEEAGGSGA